MTLALVLSGCATTSNTFPPRDGTYVPPDQDLKLAAYNVALGAVSGGVGALINGNEGPPLRRFLRGAGWGAAGGSLAYMGKWHAGNIAENGRIAYAIPARLLHDAGLSIVESAAHDRPPLDRFATHLGLIRVDVRPREKSVRARLLPVTTIVFGLFLFDSDLTLDVGRSLAFGSPLFVADEIDTIFGGNQFDGYAVYGSVVIKRQRDGFNYGIAAHEFVHILQYNEMARIESILRAPLDDPLRRSSVYRGLAGWIYLDSPALSRLASLAIEGGAIDFPCKYDNWFEREAEAFGLRRPVEVCR